MNHSLNEPWLVAVWPGMGNVALSAGAYLLEKLGAEFLVELDAEDHYELETVRVEDGIVMPGGMPRTRFYGWKNPDPEGRDLVILTGEAQPSRRAFDYCRKVLRVADTFGVKRVVTFASMVTPTAPSSEVQVFGVATGPSLLRELNEAASDPLAVIKSGAISGLNGALLAAAASRGQEGFCLLGQVPQIAAQVPYLRATHAVLDLFSAVAGVELELDELRVQAEAVDQGLAGLLDKLKRMAREAGVQQTPDWMALGNDEFEVELSEGLPKLPLHDDEDEAKASAPDDGATNPALEPGALARVESLFLSAQDDREQALELKAELDRLGLFAAYEDRFLDLFRPPAGGDA